MISVFKVTNYIIITVLSFFLFKLNLPPLLYAIAFLVLVLNFIQSSKYILTSVVIVLVSSTTSSILNNTDATGNPIETFSNSISFPGINISIPEVFYLSLIAFVLLKGLKIPRVIFFVLCIILIGGIISSYNALNYGNISAWSGGFRTTLIPFSFLAGYYLKEIKGKEFIIDLLVIILAVYFTGASIFKLVGHIGFLAAAAIGCLCFFLKFKKFVLLSLIFIAHQIIFAGGFTITIILSYVIPILTYFLSSKANYLGVSFHKLKKGVALIPLVFIGFFLFILSNLQGYYSIFFTHNVSQGITLTSDFFLFSLYKLGDRITFWKPYFDNFLAHPFEMIYQKPLYYVNILETNNGIHLWTTHPHNVVIGLLNFYGAIFGSLFILFICYIFYKVISVLTRKPALDKADIAALALFMSSLGGFIFGFFPIEFNIGFIYWILAGWILAPDNNFTNEYSSYSSWK